MRRVLVAIMFGVAVASGGQAMAATADAAAPRGPSNGDPWQPVNRIGFAIHQFLDRLILRPAAMTYQRLTPSPLRQGVHNLLGNLGEPAVAVNDLFQGRVRKAGLTTVRFVTNSTVGIAGVFDVASRLGAPHHDNSFALTLGRAHVQPGPFLFIPLVGPSTVRDVVGAVVDATLDPLHWVRYKYSTEVTVARVVAYGLDQRSRADADLKALLADATDPYATLRSVYLQNEQSRINDSGAVVTPALPDFGDQPDAAAPSTATPAPPPAADAPASTPPADATDAPTPAPPPAAVPSTTPSPPAS